jgi:hypothetical protein
VQSLYFGLCKKWSYKKDNRIAFSKVNIQQFRLDWQRARNEIPVIDIKTGEVKYGVNALADILQQRFVFIKFLLKIKWLDWLFKKLYKLVSYNRKIIVAKKIISTPGIDCTPDYSFLWRWVLIITCYVMSNVFIIASTSVVCKIFALQLKPSVVIFWMLVPLLFSLFVSKKTATEIHAHIAITSTMSGFLLFVVCCCVKFFNLSLMIANFFFVLVLITVVMQLTRRYFFMKYWSNS